MKNAQFLLSPVHLRGESTEKRNRADSSLWADNGCRSQPKCSSFAQVVHGVQVCTLLAHRRKPGGNRHNITQCTSKQVWLLLFPPPAGPSPAATGNLALRMLLQVVSGAWPPMHTITIWRLEADYCPIILAQCYIYEARCLKKSEF